MSSEKIPARIRVGGKFFLFPKTAISMVYTRGGKLALKRGVTKKKCMHYNRYYILPYE